MKLNHFLCGWSERLVSTRFTIVVSSRQGCAHLLRQYRLSEQQGGLLAVFYPLNYTPVAFKCNMELCCIPGLVLSKEREPFIVWPLSVLSGSVARQQYRIMQNHICPHTSFWWALETLGGCSKRHLDW